MLIISTACWTQKLPLKEWKEKCNILLFYNKTFKINFKYKILKSKISLHDFLKIRYLELYAILQRESVLERCADLYKG